MISLAKLSSRVETGTVIEVDWQRPRGIAAGTLSLADLEEVRITSRQDIRPAAVFLRDLALAKGLRVACAQDISDKCTLVDADERVLAREVFGWDGGGDAWWQNPRIALNSPITMACRFESEPFWVNAQGFHTQVPNPYLEGISLENFEARAMTAAALVVPVHMPFGQIGVVCLVPDDQARTDLWDLFTFHGDMLAIYSRMFLSSYVRLMATPRALPADTLLSKREVECLRWAALGKTDLEIGMILSRSRATVRFHIHKASLKLNAVNRCQTLFKAAQLGYIALG